MRLTSTFLVAALIALPACDLRGATIYAENFNQAVGTSGTSLTSTGNTTGWVGWFEASDASDVVQPSGTASNVDSIKLPILPGFDGETGYLSAQDASPSNANSEIILLTPEYTIDRALHDVTTVTWQSKNSHRDSQMRVAVRIAGQWYASDAVFKHDVDNGPWRLNTFNFSTAGSAWRNLTFTTGVGGNIAVGNLLSGELPSGAIDAFGLYARTGFSDSNISVTVRVDDFAIEAEPVAVPEPAAGIGLLVALACAAWARRRGN